MFSQKLNDLTVEERALLDEIRSSDSDKDAMLQLGLHMISWQKSERNMINGFFKDYSKPIYEIVGMMSERMTKLEDSYASIARDNNKMHLQLADVLSEVKHMVKCVDKAIIENKEYDKRIKKLEEKHIALEVRSSTNWATFGKIIVGIISATGVAVAIIFGVSK